MYMLSIYYALSTRMRVIKSMFKRSAYMTISDKKLEIPLGLKYSGIKQSKQYIIKKPEAHKVLNEIGGGRIHWLACLLPGI